MLTITLSWPEPALWPNSRRHWSNKARAARDAKSEAFLTTRSQLFLYPPGPDIDPGGKILLDVTGCPPNTRRRDLDNFIAALKHQFDGIAQALGVDDSRFRYDVGWGEPAPPRGSVTVEIGE